MLDKVMKINENEPSGKKNIHFRKTSDGKQILRDMMARYIPEDVTRAEKQGFSSPDASWFRGKSIEFVDRSLLGPRARIYDVLDRGAVAPLIEEHMQGGNNRRLLIWSLLNVEAWMRDTLE